MSDVPSLGPKPLKFPWKYCWWARRTNQNKNRLLRFLSGTNTNLSLHTHTCTHIHPPTQACTHMHAHTHAWYVCTLSHTYKQTNIHTHTAIEGNMNTYVCKINVTWSHWQGWVYPCSLRGLELDPITWWWWSGRTWPITWRGWAFPVILHLALFAASQAVSRGNLAGSTKPGSYSNSMSAIQNWKTVSCYGKIKAFFSLPLKLEEWFKWSSSQTWRPALLSDGI